LSPCGEPPEGRRAGSGPRTAGRPDGVNRTVERAAPARGGASAVAGRPQRSRVARAFLRNRLGVAGGAALLACLGSALFAPHLAPYDPYRLDLAHAFQAPSWRHLLGTDNFGRDVLSRLIYGSRISLLVGVVVVAFAGSVGTALGLLAGYLGGWLDLAVMRVVEICFAFPFLVLVIAIIAVLGPNIVNVVWVLGLVNWPFYARLVRSHVLALRRREYVEVARALGARDARIMLRHILPNSLTPVIVASTFGVPQAILALAALGFLGLGAQPPAPEWGAMVSTGREFIFQDPWLITWPGVCIAIVVLSFNFLGDGMRDALDPRAQRV